MRTQKNLVKRGLASIMAVVLVITSIWITPLTSKADSLPTPNALSNMVNPSEGITAYTAESMYEASYIDLHGNSVVLSGDEESGTRIYMDTDCNGQADDKNQPVSIEGLTADSYGGYDLSTYCIYGVNKARTNKTIQITLDEGANVSSVMGLYNAQSTVAEKENAVVITNTKDVETSIYGVYSDDSSDIWVEGDISITVQNYSKTPNTIVGLQAQNNRAGRTDLLKGNVNLAFSNSKLGTVYGVANIAYQAGNIDVSVTNCSVSSILAADIAFNNKQVIYGDITVNIDNRTAETGYKELSSVYGMQGQSYGIQEIGSLSMTVQGGSAMAIYGANNAGIVSPINKAMYMYVNGVSVSGAYYGYYINNMDSSSLQYAGDIVMNVNDMTKSSPVYVFGGNSSKKNDVKGDVTFTADNAAFDTLIVTSFCNIEGQQNATMNHCVIKNQCNFMNMATLTGDLTVDMADSEVKPYASVNGLYQSEAENVFMNGTNLTLNNADFSAAGYGCTIRKDAVITIDKGTYTSTGFTLSATESATVYGSTNLNIKDASVSGYAIKVAASGIVGHGELNITGTSNISDDCYIMLGNGGIVTKEYGGDGVVTANIAKTATFSYQSFSKPTTQYCVAYLLNEKGVLTVGGEYTFAETNTGIDSLNLDDSATVTIPKDIVIAAGAFQSSGEIYVAGKLVAATSASFGSKGCFIQGGSLELPQPVNTYTGIYYPITVEENLDLGEVSFVSGHKSPSKGDVEGIYAQGAGNIKVAVVPERGYKVESVSLKDSENEVTNQGTEYSFVMPNVEAAVQVNYTGNSLSYTKVQADPVGVVNEETTITEPLYDLTSILISGDASKGTREYKLAAENALPEGLLLSEDGLIYGTPVTAGEATVSFVVTGKNKNTVSIPLTIKILEAGSTVPGQSGLDSIFINEEDHTINLFGQSVVIDKDNEAKTKFYLDANKDGAADSDTPLPLINQEESNSTIDNFTAYTIYGIKDAETKNTVKITMLDGSVGTIIGAFDGVIKGQGTSLDIAIKGGNVASLKGSVNAEIAGDISVTFSDGYVGNEEANDIVISKDTKVDGNVNFELKDNGATVANSNARSIVSGGSVAGNVNVDLTQKTDGKNIFQAVDGTKVEGKVDMYVNTTSTNWTTSILPSSGSITDVKGGALYSKNNVYSLYGNYTVTKPISITGAMTIMKDATVTIASNVTVGALKTSGYGNTSTAQLMILEGVLFTVNGASTFNGVLVNFGTLAVQSFSTAYTKYEYICMGENAVVTVDGTVTDTPSGHLYIPVYLEYDKYQCTIEKYSEVKSFVKNGETVYFGAANSSYCGFAIIPKEGYIINKITGQSKSAVEASVLAENEYNKNVYNISTSKESITLRSHMVGTQIAISKTVDRASGTVGVEIDSDAPCYDLSGIEISNDCKATDLSVTYEVAEDSALPEGLLLDANTGKITGNPQKAYVDGKTTKLIIHGKNGTDATINITFTIQKGEYVLSPYAEIQVEYETTLADVELADGYEWGEMVDVDTPLTILGKAVYAGVYQNAEQADNYNIAQVIIPIEVVCTQATEVSRLINAIGVVTYTEESKEAIDAARTAYDNLSTAKKGLISQWDINILTKAETTYNTLEQEAIDAAAKEAADKKAVQDVKDKIEAIGTVTINSEEAIKEAQEAYNGLTEEQKALVSPTIVAQLNAAKESYEKIKEAKAQKKPIGNQGGSQQTPPSGVPSGTPSGTSNTTEAAPTMSTQDTDTKKTLAVGERTTSKGLQYQIISETEVSLIGVDNKKTTTITIPASIMVDEVTYQVTQIGKNALKNCKKLKKVTIGASITNIGANAFSGCKKLKSIKVKTALLKTVGKNALKGIHKKAVISVPKKQKKAYKKIFKKKGQKATVVIK